MDTDALSDLIRRLGRRQPFRPYVVQLASGVDLTVRHPEALNDRDDGSFLLVTRSKSRHYFDASGVTQVYRLPNDVPLPPDPY